MLEPRVAILRIGHRLVRDDRVTTHAGLVARAFGAERIWIVGAEPKVEQSIDEISTKWGGNFEVDLVDDWKNIVKNWKGVGGIVVHLTMYGQSLDYAVEQVRALGKAVLVIIGAEKVPGQVFGLADFNVAVGDQPHSEISALALFLDRFYRGEELKQGFPHHKIRVVPSERGKKIEAV